MDNLKIFLLGTPRILFNDEPIRVDTRNKTIALLSYLAVERSAVSRETIADLLWEQTNEQKVKASLRRTLSVTTKALNKQWLIVDPQKLELEADAGLEVDLWLFDETIAAVENHHIQNNLLCEDCYIKLKNIVELYQGDFLSGFYLGDSSQFDNWQQIQQGHYRQELINIFNRLVTWSLQNQYYEDGIRFAEHWRKMDEYADLPVNYLLQMYAHTGQRNNAINLYTSFVELLDEELGVSPIKETREIYGQIIQDDASAKDVVLTNLPVSTPPNLPYNTKPFIGRIAELDYLQQRLEDPTCRLLNIVATGGMGKTHLATQVGQQFYQYFPHGVFFYSLQQQTTTDKLIAGLAEAIDYRFYKGVPLLQQLTDYLRAKSILLIVDNFEHYQGDISLLTALLEEAPRLKLLVTSQKMIGLQEEWVFSLKGLVMPAKLNGELLQAEAIQFFNIYTRKLIWDYDITSDLDDVLALCQILEGVPLALELATAQLMTTSCQLLVETLTRDIQSMETIYQNVPPRHRSLFAIFEYSWQHLTDIEQEALLCLTIFRGGFSSSDAIYLFAVEPDVLASLQTKALISELSPDYFTIPHTLQLFLEQKPLVHKDELRAQHATYFAEMTTNFDLEFEQVYEDSEAFKQSALNIQAGWEYALNEQDLALIQHFMYNFFIFFEMQGRYEEGLTYFDEAFAQLSEIRPLNEDVIRLLARLKVRIGIFYHHLGRINEAQFAFQEGLSFQDLISDFEELPWTLNGLGVLALVRDEHDDAENYLHQSLKIAEEHDDQLNIARTVANLGILARSQQHYDTALEHLQRSHAIYADFKHQRLLAGSLNNLGNVYFDLQDFARATHYYEASYTQNERLGDQWGAACSLINLGQVTMEQTDYEKAKSQFFKCLDICEEMGKKSGIARSHFYLARVYQEIEDFAKALQHYGQSLSLEDQIGNIRRIINILNYVAEIKLAQTKVHEAAEIWYAIVNDTRSPKIVRDKAATHQGAIDTKPRHTLTIEQIYQQFLQETGEFSST